MLSVSTQRMNDQQQSFKPLAPLVSIMSQQLQLMFLMVELGDQFGISVNICLQRKTTMLEREIVLIVLLGKECLTHLHTFCIDWCTVIFAEHFGANNMILGQVVRNLLDAKLCAVFSGTPCM